VACLGGVNKYMRVIYMKETDDLEDLDRDGRIALKCILRRTGWRGLDYCRRGKAPSDLLI